MLAADAGPMTWPPGNGPGWGGPARGAGWGGPARGATTMPGRGDSRRIAARRAKAEAIRARLYDLAMDAPDERTALAAADALLDRLEGKPVAMILTATSPSPDLASLSDDALAAMAADLDAEAAKADKADKAETE